MSEASRSRTIGPCAVSDNPYMSRRETFVGYPAPPVPAHPKRSPAWGCKPPPGGSPVTAARWQ